MRGTSIFSSIGKAIFEGQAGRINWRSNMWALIGSQWDKRRIRNTAMIGHKSVNELGEFISEDHTRTLVKKPNTNCPCAPGNDFYFDGKWYWVPAIVCRKCQYHRSSNRSFRFPRCTYRRPMDMKSVATNTLVQMDSLVKKAVEGAEEIVKGKL